MDAESVRPWPDQADIHQTERTTPGGSRPGSGTRQGFLEPVLSVGLVVESGDLDVPGGPVEVDRLGQPAAGFQAHHGDPPPAGVLLEFGQDTPPNAKAAS